MNKVRCRLFTLGVGVASGLGIYSAMEATEPDFNAAEVNEHVEECASALGDMAVSTEVLPQECAYFETTLDKKTTITRIIEGKTGQELEYEETIFYQLPSRQEFLDEEYITPAEEEAQRARDERGVKLFASFAGAYFSLFGYLGYRNRSTADERASRPNTPERV